MLVKEAIYDQEEITIKPVSSTRRFLNFLIDLALWSTFLLLVHMIIDLKQLSSVNVFDFSFLSATFLVYYFFMEVSCQKTVGKFITGTRVVNRQGNKPTPFQILLRTISRLIPLDQFSFLFLRRGFHDYFSNTVVIGEEGDQID